MHFLKLEIIDSNQLIEIERKVIKDHKALWKFKLIKVH